DMLRQRLMGLVMMLLLVVALVLTVSVNAAAGYFPQGVAWMASFVAGAIVMVALLVALYRFVPNRTFRFRDVLPGALLAGVLFAVLSRASPLCAGLAGSFHPSAPHFAFFFLLASCFSSLSQLVLLGAVYNRFRLGAPAAKAIIESEEHTSKLQSRF